MSQLNEAVTAKVLALKVNPQAYVELFEAIAADAAMRDIPSATCIVPIYAEGDLQVGDFAPELHFVVRRVSDPEENENPPSDE